ncbi:ParB/RepB/Spo0J family partition protein [Pararhizobium sp. IMCC21322]|uniref:ParB/RepB/Spo0J family partition protein n=1 Tax=Pararhizobium sp. IMCC21322 TaxID=3067903 RepID=UPI0027428918|nr:ParB/RepB/Spo0J family partition protein [Pararhizobium sp. IMCC21322]
MADDISKKRLGRGLAALLGDVDTDAEAVERARSQRRVPIEFVTPNPNNPRRSFAADDLEDLTRSVREKGIVQPILVRPQPGKPISDNRYEIIAGERRWRAAQAAGLHEIPVLIQAVSDKEALELAIVENVQRSDLNPIEEARGYQQLLDGFDYTQQDLATVIGKSRSHVANTLRLLKLPDGVQKLLQDGELTAGHAKILVAADDPAALASQIVDGHMSVRAAETLARSAGEGQKGSGSSQSTASALVKDADTQALENSLSEVLGLLVDLRHKPNGTGELRVKYKTLDQLDFITAKLRS